MLHNIDPVFDEHSEVLILGSFPSVKSREEGFFYAHPQNRFWKLLALIYDQAEPKTADEKRTFLLKNHIALWDVIASCEVTGSSDSSIKNVIPNDISLIMQGSRVKRVFCNGATSARLYEKYILPKTNIPAFTLPSTSPANAAYSLERLYDKWQIILNEDEKR